MMLRPQIRVVAALVVLATALGACGGDGGDDRAGASPKTTTSTTATTSANAVPTELQDRWQTRLDDGVLASLTLRADGYKIARSGAIGEGAVSVEGDVITFSTTQCTSGPGSYRWALGDDRLTLTVIGTDPCPRSAVLEGNTFERTP